MPLLLVALAGLVIWLLSGRKLPDRRLWPVLLLGLVGLLLIAKGEPIFGLLVTAGAWLWAQQKRLIGKRSATRAQVEANKAEERAARELLGLDLGADRNAILAAHRNLIARNHPDTGGSADLAARINAARDVLLKTQPD